MHDGHAADLVAEGTKYERVEDHAQPYTKVFFLQVSSQNYVYTRIPALHLTYILVHISLHKAKDRRTRLPQEVGSGDIS